MKKYSALVRTQSRRGGIIQAASTFLLMLAVFSGCATLDIVRDRIESPVIDGDKVVFYYDSDSAKSVSAAGEFNGWEYRPEQPRAIVMKRNEKGVWQASADIAPGRYQYKIVIDYQTWITDPYNANTVDDGTGNLNSLLVVK
ncbi:MAG: glycogen-binding domain-containing protein [Endomicrobiia bacterium]|nr:glycogen-binding domain-containing protein [Endomicrobiia bacterium]